MPILRPVERSPVSGDVSEPRPRNLNNLGGKVSVREVIWGDLCQKAWGSEFHAPDHKIYMFSNNRAFDSSDKGRTGIYGIEVTEPLEFSYPDDWNYKDMDSSIYRSNTEDPIHTDNPGQNPY